MMLNALTLLVASVPSYFKQAAGEKEKTLEARALWATHSFKAAVNHSNPAKQEQWIEQSERELQTFEKNRRKYAPDPVKNIFFCDNEWRTSVCKSLE